MAVLFNMLPGQVQFLHRHDFLRGFGSLGRLRQLWNLFFQRTVRHQFLLSIQYPQRQPGLILHLCVDDGLKGFYRR